MKKNYILIILLISFTLNFQNLYPQQKIYCFGNSLTKGAGGNGVTYPDKLAQLTGLEVINAGLSSQTSTQIAARFGVRPVYVSVWDNVLTTTPAIFTQIQNININITLDVSLSDKYTAVSGTLCGVHGRILFWRENTNWWYFQRDKEGAAVSCPANSQFIVDKDYTDNDIIVFWMGRNNIYEKDVILKDIKACVDNLSPTKRRFLVLSLTVGTSETPGTTGYNTVMDINAALKTAYPNNYVDVFKVLSGGSYGSIPSSLLSDYIHLNSKGYELVAETIYKELISKKWIAANSVNDVYLNNEIHINNPVKSILAINFPEPTNEQSNVEIVDLSGKKVLQQPVSSGVSSLEVNIEHLSKGIYILKCNDSFTKFVKE